MSLRIEEARKADAAAIAALRLSVARQLTVDFGKGTWSFAAESEAGVRADIMTAKVLVMRDEGTIVGTLRLSPRLPWIVPIDGFTPGCRPLYLTSMAVLPKRQRQGVGRACVEAAKEYAAAAGADVIRLDAYDASAGAGEFYRKCGFHEVRRAPYNGTPLIFFECFVGDREPIASAAAPDARSSPV